MKLLLTGGDEVWSLRYNYDQHGYIVSIDHITKFGGVIRTDRLIDSQAKYSAEFPV